MDASTRRTSISNMSSKIRLVLMKHMEGSEDSPADQVDRSSRKLGSSSIRLRAVAKGTTGGTAGCKYSAQMDIDCLRTYTRQVAFDLAIEHQLVLSDLRDKLVAASEMNASIWSPPYKVPLQFHESLVTHSNSFSFPWYPVVQRLTLNAVSTSTALVLKFPGVRHFPSSSLVSPNLCQRTRAQCLRPAACI